MTVLTFSKIKVQVKSQPTAKWSTSDLSEPFVFNWRKFFLQCLRSWKSKLVLNHFRHGWLCDINVFEDSSSFLLRYRPEQTCCALCCKVSLFCRRRSRVEASVLLLILCIHVVSLLNPTAWNQVFNQHLTRHKCCTVELPETFNKMTQILVSFFSKCFYFLPKPSKHVSLRPKPHRMWTVFTAIPRRVGGEHSDRSEAQRQNFHRN